MSTGTMGAARRHPGASLAFVLALVATLLVTPVVARATATELPDIHTPAPRPGAVVSAGPVVIGAWVRAAAGIAEARVWLDGLPVLPVHVVEDGDARGSRVEAAVELSVGTHGLRVEVRDANGATAQRDWIVTATDRTVSRHAGASRVDTAVAISRATFPQDASAAAAVLARADEFADALAGAPLAAAEDGPLLLTGGAQLAAEVGDELVRALPPGATVHLLGGTAALAAAVAADVEALGFVTARHAGADRFATAAAVAAALPPTTGAILASGSSFPDALAASAPAARDGLPILLTDRDALPDASADMLRARGVSTLTIVGGTAVVSADVETAAAEVVDRVARVAGPDRYATAVAVLQAFFSEVPAGISLASGVSFPDALSGTRHAAARGQPLLLVAPDALPPATAEALRRLRPRHLDVYGGTTAVAAAVPGAAIRAAVDGPDGPRVTAVEPAAASVVQTVTGATIHFDRPITLEDASVYLELAGEELAGRLHTDGDGAVRLELPGPVARELDLAHPATVVVRALAAGGAVHDEVSFTLLQPHPVYATIGALELRLPSVDVELVGFHQSGHDGARAQDATDSATPKIVLPSRGRGTGRTTAADIVANPDVRLTAPVTGTVRRAGTYRLYCDHVDHYLVIEPDDRPGWEVKVLHFTGLKVAAGDRVVAGETVIGDGPRILPFESQVDRYSQDRNWPHVHLEVVDPSIPDRGGGGSC